MTFLIRVLFDFSSKFKVTATINLRLMMALIIFSFENFRHNRHQWAKNWQEKLHCDHQNDSRAQRHNYFLWVVIAISSISDDVNLFLPSIIPIVDSSGPKSYLELSSFHSSTEVERYQASKYSITKELWVLLPRHESPRLRE